MLDSLQIAEIIAATKREEIERVVKRQRLLAEAGAPDTRLHPRQAIAEALMRLARVIDDGAGHRTAAPAH
jgi:hypothetical protein